MNDDIIEMARESDVSIRSIWDGIALKRFAALVAAAEREACAELAFEMLVKVEGTDFDVPDAIRARGNT